MGNIKKKKSKRKSKPKSPVSTKYRANIMNNVYGNEILREKWENVDRSKSLQIEL